MEGDANKRKATRDECMKPIRDGVLIINCAGIARQGEVDSECARQHHAPLCSLYGAILKEHRLSTLQADGNLFDFERCYIGFWAAMKFE